MRGDVTIGTCAHGNALHYRYPCAECEADHVLEKLEADYRACTTPGGLRPENGLLVKIRQHVVECVASLSNRINQSHL